MRGGLALLWLAFALAYLAALSFGVPGVIGAR